MYLCALVKSARGFTKRVTISHVPPWVGLKLDKNHVVVIVVVAVAVVVVNILKAAVMFFVVVDILLVLFKFVCNVSHSPFYKDGAWGVIPCLPGI